MKLLQVALAAAILALSALIVFAIADGSFSQAGRWLTSEPWGLVTLADLYFGFVLSALVIWFFESRRLVALIWILPIPFLGNIWAALWFLVRLPHLRQRLAAR